MHRTKVIIGILGLGFLLGMGAGFFAGRFVWPVHYVDVSPADLRPQWQAEYVQMVAMAYAQDRDLSLARARLALLGDPIEVLRRLLSDSKTSMAPAARSAIMELSQALQRPASEPVGGHP